VSSSFNRSSITAHGLDWRRMAVTGGVAAGPGLGGPYGPELKAVFLCETLDDVEFFVGFGQHPLVDVWAVDVTGLAIEPGPDGWVLCREPIPAVRVRLLHADRPPGRRELCSVWLSSVSSRLSVGEMSALAGIAPDDAGEDDSAEIGREPGRRYAWWVLEGSDRYAALAGQAAEVLDRVAVAEAGLARLAAASDETAFRVHAASASWRLDIDAAALLDRIGAEISISVGES
jgi:hypothetical protein